MQSINPQDDWFGSETEELSELDLYQDLKESRINASDNQAIL